MSTAPLVDSGAAAVRRAARPHAAAQPRAERARRRLVAVVMLVYLLLIFEGSLRKWVLPQISLYLFFIRDPFVVYAYVYATIHGLWPKRSVLLAILVCAGALGVLVGCLQLVLGDSGAGRLELAVYGWRNYFLYAPLAVLIGAHFRLEDLARVARWTLLLCIPIGVLVAAQFWAPQGSVINVGIASDTALQFNGLGLDAEHTRPMGTFSSGAGQIQFVASAFALLLAFAITPRRGRPIGSLLLLLGACGLATCLALSGSRATVLQCALIAVAAVGLGVVGRSGAVKLRSFAVPLVLVGVFVALYPIVFPEGFESFANRWAVAGGAENRIFQGGVFGRALYGLVDFVRLLDDVPVLGYGLGIGGNASTTLGFKIQGVGPVALAETDWARHILELGPIFGSAYIVLRVALAVWLGALVLKATRRGASPLPFVLFAYAGYLLLLGTMTGQGAVNGYGWLFTGFCIAAATEQLRVARSTAAARARLAPSAHRAARRKAPVARG